MRTLVLAASTALVAASAPSFAATVDLSLLELSETQEFLLIGTGPRSTAVAVNVGSSHELGADTDGVVPADGLSGPDLGDARIPDGGFQAVPTGILGNGNIAITDPDGEFTIDDTDVYASLAIQCTAANTDCEKSFSNSTFNTLNDADVEFNNLNSLVNEYQAAIDLIPDLMATGTVDFGDGTVQEVDWVTNLSSGLNVLDLTQSDGGDFSLNNASWIIDGFEDSYAIIRVSGGNFLTSNASILAGDGGIGLENILFFSEETDNNENFNLSNTLVNGVSFWSPFGEINGNNVQGCTQFLAPKINFNDVILSRCGFNIPPEVEVVPVPASLPLLFAGIAGLGILSRRRRAA